MLQRGGPLRTPAALAASLLAGWVMKRAGLLGVLGLASRRGRGSARGPGQGSGVLDVEDEGGGRRAGRRRADGPARGLSSEERLLLAYDHVDTVFKVGAGAVCTRFCV